jgi:hypothetical protein
MLDQRPEVFAFYRQHPALLVLAGEPVQAPDALVEKDLRDVIDQIDARNLVGYRVTWR